MNNKKYRKIIDDMFIEHNEEQDNKLDKLSLLIGMVSGSYFTLELKHHPDKFEDLYETMLIMLKELGGK
jgi:hypothetical protein